MYVFCTDLKTSLFLMFCQSVAIQSLRVETHAQNIVCLKAERTDDVNVELYGISLLYYCSGVGMWLYLDVFLRHDWQIYRQLSS